MRAALPVILCLLAACTPNGDEAAPLRVDTPDPRALRQVVAESVSEGLTARDASGAVVPGVAQSWRVSDDGLSIVFRLRAATFADGSTVTAADAVASLQAARAGRAGPQMRDLLAGISSITAPLESVVEIQLSTPQPELLELLASPRAAIRKGGTGSQAGAFIARAEAATADAPAVTRLSRNDRFHGAEQVALAQATVRELPVEEGIRRFRLGETDLLLGGGLDGYGAARAAARPEQLLLERPRAVLLLLVNYRRPPLDQRNVRRALQIGVDRGALGPAFFGTQAATAVQALSPANIEGYSPPRPDWADLPFAARQLEATRLLTEAGLPAGPLALTVAISDSPAEARLLEKVAADYAAVGIQLKLARRSPEAHLKAIRAGDFDLAILRRDTPAATPLPFLWPFLCDRNRHGVCLPEADKLVAGSWRAPSNAERMQTLAAAERLWAEDGAAIGLVQPLGWSLVSPRVAGISANPGGSHPLRLMSLQPERKLIR